MAVRESNAAGDPIDQPAPKPESATRVRARRPRILATVTDYADLVSALRQRCDDLGLTFDTLDEVCGFCDRYTAKLLAPYRRASARPLRSFGGMSLGAILGGLGLKIVLVEDRAALARVRGRYRPRKYKRPRGWQARVPPMKQVWTTPVIEEIESAGG
jgi:phytoene dehydrogenase-like protein